MLCIDGNIYIYDFTFKKNVSILYYLTQGSLDKDSGYTADNISKGIFFKQKQKKPWNVTELLFTHS